MKDPDFLREAATMRLEITPISGNEVQELVAEVFQTPNEIVERTRALLR